MPVSRGSHTTKEAGRQGKLPPGMADGVSTTGIVIGVERTMMDAVMTGMCGATLTDAGNAGEDTTMTTPAPVTALGGGEMMMTMRSAAMAVTLRKDAAGCGSLMFTSDGSARVRQELVTVAAMIGVMGAVDRTTSARSLAISGVATATTTSLLALPWRGNSSHQDRSPLCLCSVGSGMKPGPLVGELQSRGEGLLAHTRGHLSGLCGRGPMPARPGGWVAIAIDKLSAPATIVAPGGVVTPFAAASPVAPTDTLALDDPANAEQAEPARQAAANDPVDDLQATLGPTVQPEAAIHTPMLSTSAVDFPQVPPAMPCVLFKSPHPSILPSPPLQCADVNLQTPPPPMPRQDRHRSSRLAQQPTVGLPSGLKAQLNLCRRMGLTPEEGTLTDKVVADFKAMFNAPLPQDTIDALEQLFGLNREDAKAADAVLAKYLGPTDACYREELAAAT